MRLHQQFKWAVVSRLNQKANFVLHSWQIDSWLAGEIVSDHWRGNPAIGVKQSRYRVEHERNA